MRTKAQIENKINQIRGWRDSAPNYPLEESRIFRQSCNLMVKALQYALGHKVGEWYWCWLCMRYHKGRRCSRCGNDNVLNSPNDKEG